MFRYHFNYCWKKKNQSMNKRSCVKYKDLLFPSHPLPDLSPHPSLFFPQSSLSLSPTYFPPSSSSSLFLSLLAVLSPLFYSLYFSSSSFSLSLSFLFYSSFSSSQSPLFLFLFLHISPHSHHFKDLNWHKEHSVQWSIIILSEYPFYFIYLFIYYFLFYLL